MISQNGSYNDDSMPVTQDHRNDKYDASIEYGKPKDGGVRDSSELPKSVIREVRAKKQRALKKSQLREIECNVNST